MVQPAGKGQVVLRYLVTQVDNFDGELDGSSEGETLGDKDGLVLGVMLGTSLGATDGFDEGDLLGWLDNEGSSLGASLG